MKEPTEALRRLNETVADLIHTHGVTHVLDAVANEFASECNRPCAFLDVYPEHEASARRAANECNDRCEDEHGDGSHLKRDDRYIVEIALAKL